MSQVGLDPSQLLQQNTGPGPIRLLGTAIMLAFYDIDNKALVALSIIVTRRHLALSTYCGVR